ncbi:fructosamine kinase family protein [Actinoplanes sp. NPDC026619]|uniref:fructosamine kinase family protein n=1 Tax=Actinoplanes sp. NPDC026619 TaxID=3155798 RepID=UPI00340E9564
MREFLALIEPVVASHLGVPWRATGFTDLGDRASHRCGIFRGSPIDVFAKLNTGGETAPELRGLSLLRCHGVPVPTPIGEVPVAGGTLLLQIAIPEISERTPAQWAAIGRVLGTLHRVYGESFGLDFDGFFGPLPQDNRPCPDWPSFYASRRLLPLLRMAVDAGHLDSALSAGVSRVIDRLPLLCGPEMRPALLHGDAQQNNFLTAPDGAYLLDVSPYYGHPEVDLALLDYFAPVPPTVFDAYRSVTPIDPDFPSRRELWRLHGYLAVIAVDGASDFGRPFLARVADVIRRYG